jgi:hypothetical protein
LAGGRGDVHRVGVGHRLDDDRGATADLDFAYFNAYRFVALLSQFRNPCLLANFASAFALFWDRNSVPYSNF